MRFMTNANEAERRLHLSAVEALSERLHAPPEAVAGVYESVLADVAGRARIKEYLSILVSRRVRSVLEAGVSDSGPTALRSPNDNPADTRR
jgi:hypothetical protein